MIASFQERLEAPVEAEGFVLWRSRCQDELESAIEEIQELADRSEVDFAEVSASRSDNTQKWSHVSQLPDEVCRLRNSGSFVWLIGGLIFVVFV